MSPAARAVTMKALKLYRAQIATPEDHVDEAARLAEIAAVDAALGAAPDAHEVEIARLREALRDCVSVVEREVQELIDSGCVHDASGAPKLETLDPIHAAWIMPLRETITRAKAALSKHGA